MSDGDTTVEVLRNAVRSFAAERQWEGFHNPKNLSMGLACEAAELMEHFLWVEGEASRRVTTDRQEFQEVTDEVADVACYVLNLCNTLDIDLASAVLAKIAKNALKYPAEKYRGRYQAE